MGFDFDPNRVSIVQKFVYDDYHGTLVAATGNDAQIWYASGGQIDTWQQSKLNLIGNSWVGGLESLLYIPPSGSDGAVLLAGSGDSIYANSPRARVYKSVDGGKNWTNVADFYVAEGYLLGVSSVQDMAYDSKRGRIMALIKLRSQLWTSDDLGENWIKRHTFSTTGVDLSIVWDEAHECALVHVDNEMYKSTDGGNTWTLKKTWTGVGSIQSSMGYNSALQTVFIGTNDTGTVPNSGYIYRTEDGGETYQLDFTFTGNSEVQDFKYAPSTRKMVVALKRKDVYMRNDYWPSSSSSSVSSSSVSSSSSSSSLSSSSESSSSSSLSSSSSSSSSSSTSSSSLSSSSLSSSSLSSSSESSSSISTSSSSSSFSITPLLHTFTITSSASDGRVYNYLGASWATVRNGTDGNYVDTTSSSQSQWGIVAGYTTTGSPPYYAYAVYRNFFDFDLSKIPSGGGTRQLDSAKVMIYAEGYDNSNVILQEGTGIIGVLTTADYDSFTGSPLTSAQDWDTSVAQFQNLQMNALGLNYVGSKMGDWIRFAAREYDHDYSNVDPQGGGGSTQWFKNAVTYSETIGGNVVQGGRAPKLIVKYYKTPSWFSAMGPSFWTVVKGSWDGSKYTATGVSINPYELDLTATGAWVLNFHPSIMRITFTAGFGPLDVDFRNTDGDEEILDDSQRDDVVSGEQVVIWNYNNLPFDTFVTTGPFAGGSYDITNIEFLEP